MVELARKYVDTHGPKIIKELYKLVRELEKMEKGKKGRRVHVRPLYSFKSLICRKSDNPIDRYFFHDLIEVGPRAKGFISRWRQTS